MAPDDIQSPIQSPFEIGSVKPLDFEKAKNALLSRGK